MPGKGINLAEKNGQWKGDDVGYSSIHSWVKRRKLKTGFCQDCHVNTERLDLANISQAYKRDITDWEWLCRLCHMKKDGKAEKFAEFGRKLDHKKFPSWVNRPISKGTSVNTNKLTEKQVIKIRKLLKNKSMEEVAKKFNVQKPCIWKISTGRNWKWLKGGN